MAVYYKFKSAKDYDSISMDGHFISVANLKEKIFESKHLGRGTDFDLVVTNAQTNEEYLDEGMLIPKNTSVLIRRVPGRPRMPIVTAPVINQDEPEIENKPEDIQVTNSGILGADLSVSKYPEDNEWDEFGNDLYAIPEMLPVQSSNPVQDAPPPSKADEESKIRALIETPALDWQRQNSDGFGAGRGFGRGMGGRMGGRGFGRGVGMERKTPPQGYICHRCKVAGHFIQHCPTNGDPTFDIKRVKPPTGIPKSMLMATPDGSYALPSGAVAVLKPNEAAFEKEIEGMPSTRSVGDLPPELHCPLCREVMKDAVLTSKCCFKSFCDKCIRDYIISKSMCVCGVTNVLADDLLPNKTLRDAINRILESNNSSGDNGGSVFQVQDMESARCPQRKIPSPTLSAASKGEQVPPQQLAPQNEETTNNQNKTEPIKVAEAPEQTLDKLNTAKVADVSEATHDSRTIKEPASQGSVPVLEEELQQKPVSGEAGKKKKKKKSRLPLGAAEMQWRASQDFPPENYMMHMGPPSAYNPFWNGMQPGMDGFGGHFGGPMPYMGYGLGPLPMDIPFGGVFPHDPFAAQVNMMPFPPQRDFPEHGMGFNGGPPISREEFEARKAELRRKRDLERRGERELPRDREFSREMSSTGDINLVKSKPNSIPPPSAGHHHHNHRPRSERPSPDRRSRDPEPPRTSSKRKASEYDQYEESARLHREKEHRHHHSHHSHHSDLQSSARPPIPPVTSDAAQPPPKSSTASDRRPKASVFSRISFPEGEASASKKRKAASSSSPVDGSGHHSSSSHRAVSNGYHEDHHSTKTVAVASSKKSTSVDDYEYESSDDDRHFKRRPSRYEASPPKVEEARVSSRGTRERERGYSSSKHR